MIESRYGILCGECEYREQMNCKKCVNIENPFFGESYPVKSCYKNSVKEHCSQCKNSPYDLLHQFTYDEKQDDRGKRLEQCKK